MQDFSTPPRFSDYSYVASVIVAILVTLSSAIGQSATASTQIKLTTPAKAPILNAKAIATKTLPSVVLILASNGISSNLGSGFFVSNGIVVTNYHVVREMRRGLVRVAVGKQNEKKNFRIARILDFDEAADLAILSVPTAATASIPNLALSGNALPEVGEAIYALGNPEGLVGTISPGIVSASVRLSEKKARLQITAPISSGSSGGPVVNERAEVIGVVVSSLADGQNLNFAIPASLVKQLIARITLPGELDAAYDRLKDVGDAPPRDWIWHRQAANGSSPSDCPTVRTRYSATDTDSLKGVRAVGVLVETPDDQAARFVSGDAIKVRIEAALKRYDIPVTVATSTKAAVLYVNILCLAPRTYSSACSYRLELQQEMRSEVDKELVLLGVTTWHKSGILSGPDSSIGIRLFQTLDELTLDFVSDYLKANK